MSADVIEIGSDGGSTPTRDEESVPVIELEGNISPILVSDPDDDVPLVDLIEAGDSSSPEFVAEPEPPRESPSPDLSATDIVPPEDVVPLSIADEIAEELKKRKSKPKKVSLSLNFNPNLILDYISAGNRLGSSSTDN